MTLLHISTICIGYISAKNGWSKNRRDMQQTIWNRQDYNNNIVHSEERREVAIYFKTCIRMKIKAIN